VQLDRSRVKKEYRKCRQYCFLRSLLTSCKRKHI